MSKFNRYRITKIILYTIAVMLFTLIIDSSRHIDSFINVTLPTWLTAIGTIGAVGVAVGQNVRHNRRTEKEYNERSANARKFISALLSTHKMYFAHYHSYRYGDNKFDIIDNGDVDALNDLYNSYLNNDVIKRANDCLDDIKFAIRNVGIQADSTTIKDLSDQINAINNIDTAFSTIDTQWNNYHYARQIDINDLTEGMRINLRNIDVSLQELARDLTDKDEK